MKQKKSACLLPVSGSRNTQANQKPVRAGSPPVYGTARQRKLGFTLIELLVVIAIVALLSSVALMAFTDARKKARDAKRLADIRQVQKALEIYISKYGTLPSPSSYGRANSSPGYWDGWWDLSSNTAGNGFMNFLVAAGIVNKVPADPLNTPSGYNGAPGGSGYRYVYYTVSKNYIYQGGSCVTGKQNVYLLAISKLESDNSRPPTKFQGSNCDCLWKDAPNYFQPAFDYVTCGTY